MLKERSMYECFVENTFWWRNGKEINESFEANIRYWHPIFFFQADFVWNVSDSAISTLIIDFEKQMPIISVLLVCQVTTDARKNSCTIFSRGLHVAKLLNLEGVYMGCLDMHV